jgi:hypothetical protein
MPEILQKVVRGFLAGQCDMRIDADVPSLDSLKENTPSPMAVVVIEADPPRFAQACETLPNVRLVGITRDWHHTSVRFHDLSRERLQAVIRCLAGETIT